MSNKRGPTSELNHENWDKEDSDDEGMGDFSQATPEQLQSRVIKVAKRRSANPAGSSPANSPFSAFKGFQTASKPAEPVAGKPNFNFVLGSGGLNNGHSKDKEGLKKIQEKEKKEPETFMFKGSSQAKAEPMVMESCRQTRSHSDSPQPGTSKSGMAPSVASSDYFAQLKGLNVSLVAWITRHIEDNPYCILTPVFTDYEKHLALIEHNKPPTSSESEDSGGNLENTSASTDKKVKESSKEKNETPIPAFKSSNKLFPSISKTETDSSSESERETASFRASGPLFPKLADSSGSSVKTDVNPFKIPESASSGSTPIAFSIGSSSSSISAKFSTDTPSFGSSASAASSAVTPDVTTPSPCLSFSTPSFSTPAVQPLSASTSFFQTPMSTPSVFGSGNLFGGSTASEQPKTGFNNPSSLTFTFGSSAPAPSAASSAGPAFQFGSGGGGGGGFSFSGLAARAAEQRAEQTETEEVEEPPKVEFISVQEEGAVHEIKCKVYVRKDGDYKERGLGMLYIKCVAESKAQLLVRAATATGQILLNVLLTSAVSASRFGTNNVMLMCIANIGDTVPSAVLLRVKTGADADELLAKIEEHKA